MTPSLMPSLLAFAAVIAMIPVALWLMRRVRTPRDAGGPLALVAGLSVGPRERIVVLRAADRHLVVGITGQSMTLLAELDQAPEPQRGTRPGSVPGGFDSVLDQARNGAASGPR